MADHKANRLQILAALRAELVGPAPAGRPVDFSVPVAFAKVKDSYGPWVQAADGEEVLQRDRPLKRYGVGVLYPQRVPVNDEDSPEPEGSAAGEDLQPSEGVLTDAAADDISELAERKRRPVASESGGDDFDLTSANDYRPSTMAVTFLAHLSEGSSLEVEVSGGRYREVPVMVENVTRAWWLRAPVAIRASFDHDSLTAGDRARPVRASSIEMDGGEAVSLDVRAFSRPWGPGRRLITLSVINTATPSGSPDGWCLFQARFKAWVEAPGGPSHIEPYPKREGDRLRAADPEEASYDLLYRNARTYAIGHGCAADWSEPSAGQCAWVAAEPMPAVETPSITPEIKLPDGSELAVPMGPLAGLDPSDDGTAALHRVAGLYRQWIEDREREIPALQDGQQVAARRHLEECQRALIRMEGGIRLISEDPVAARAFRLANHAILLQQLRALPTPRTTVVDGRTGRYAVREPLEIPSWREAIGRGSWRPFQIAFMLTALESIADRRHPDRDTVELVFFPTGGGKTESYLAIAAFAMFMRRLRDPADSGVEVLMRYTLRLLTAQQFQRAAALICAMERLRRDSGGLGDEAFSIGVWLGNQATPGSKDQAKAALKKLNTGDKYAENPFVLLRCPWCSAQMGPVSTEGKAGKNTPKVAGYHESAGTVVFMCPDQTCDFRSGMPVYVTDEDIYAKQPSMVIGTVDKFAMLAWRPEARKLFGLDPAGNQVVSPPGTIIQDELHLISGPLGSIVGLYEVVIEDLCTDRRRGGAVRPKIISSTATIRRYREQIKGLYARDSATLFPPHGLDASDSFFARYAREEDGTLKPGRMYVGVHGGGLGSVQTAQVRTFAALLQAPMPLTDEERDPWWSLLIFFNSLRELGTSLSLLQSDIPDYLGAVRNRSGLEPKEMRYLRHVKELTSRLRSDEIPKAIDELSRRAGSDDPVDVCLASNIIEVGIDIDRLSVMAVVGQPKTTSQYIQVTGRIGRRWWERPGLVVTIFSPSKPRDRSHFEKFRSYHERLYAQVEPTSVTPFSPPVLDRALHAALCAYVRQRGDEQLRPWPLPDRLAGAAFDLFADRVAIVDEAEAEHLKEVFTRRLVEWQGWEPVAWSASKWGDDDHLPLLRQAGTWAPPAAALMTWQTPTSMRNVDAECMSEVTLRYAQESGADV